LIAVTGATGELGGRVARGLAALDVPQRLLVRDPARAPRLAHSELVSVPSYGEGTAMRDALRGIDTLFLVSGREQLDRVREHVSAIDAAVAAGVQRIVYTSFAAAAPDTTFTFGRDHFHTEQHIRSAGARFTFLRDNLYLDYVPLFAGADGVIRGPADDGRVAAVARDDVADVAIAVLTSDEHDGQTYDVTGPEAFTLTEAAAELSRATGRSITFEHETLEQARASRAGSGAADWEIEGWVTSYAAIANGDLEHVSDTVQRVAGHAPISLAELVQRTTAPPN
jgi:NAD(P)H dehydrogenase (quinone)